MTRRAEYLRNLLLEDRYTDAIREAMRPMFSYKNAKVFVDRFPMSIAGEDGGLIIRELIEYWSTEYNETRIAYLNKVMKTRDVLYRQRLDRERGDARRKREAEEQTNYLANKEVTHSFRPTCTTGKKMYRSEGLALNAVAALTRMGRSEKGVYKCKHCNQWHTTRQMNRNTPLYISGR